MYVSIKTDTIMNSSIQTEVYMYKIWMNIYILLKIYVFLTFFQVKERGRRQENTVQKIYLAKM